MTACHYFFTLHYTFILLYYFTFVNPHLLKSAITNNDDLNDTFSLQDLSFNHILKSLSHTITHLYPTQKASMCPKVGIIHIHLCLLLCCVSPRGC